LSVVLLRWGKWGRGCFAYRNIFEAAEAEKAERRKGRKRQKRRKGGKAEGRKGVV